MSKLSAGRLIATGDVEAYGGVDVSAARLAVAVQRVGSEGMEQHTFANTAAGHRQMIGWLRQRGHRVRVSLEATGVYSLDAALALAAAAGIEVAVLNPKVAHRFAATLRRSKTDAADAVALAEYSLRMPFVPWQRPSRLALELRGVARHIGTLSQEHARLKNQMHAAQVSAATPRCVLQDLRRALSSVEKRIAKLRGEAVRLVASDADLEHRFRLLLAMPGIAETSAVHLLGELAGLDLRMSVRQWVAMSGLDPAHQVSGTSVHRASRISRHGNRHLRRALFMPALVGARFDPHLKAFYNALRARNKAARQALIAVARKMLHAIYGIFKTDTPFDGAKLFPHILPTS